jgi:hypothetical protein
MDVKDVNILAVRKHGGGAVSLVHIQINDHHALHSIPCLAKQSLGSHAQVAACHQSDGHKVTAALGQCRNNTLCD